MAAAVMIMMMMPLRGSIRFSRQSAAHVQWWCVRWGSRGVFLFEFQLGGMRCCRADYRAPLRECEKLWRREFGKEASLLVCSGALRTCAGAMLYETQ